MLLFSGVSAKLIYSEIGSSQCPTCNEIGGIKITFYQWFFQIFFIPIFPLHKKSFVTCIKCKNEFKIKNLNTNLLWEYKEIKNKVRTPWWTFLGLFILIPFISFILYISSIFNQSKLEYIENPKIGDVYRIEFKKKEYSYCKIVEIKNDTIYFNLNKFTSHKLIEINEKEKIMDNDYNQTKIPFSKKELIHLLEKNDLYAIYRFE